MYQLVTDLFAVIDRNTSLVRILSGKINVHAQQAMHSLLEIDQFVAHAYQGFFNLLKQLHHNSP